jgi:adenylosuccinate lyase
MSGQTYETPLVERYASREMAELWGDLSRFRTWRRLWLALAEAQQALGLPLPEGALDELRAHLDDVDLDRAAAYERRLRHDVMAHVHALGDLAPRARPILHLGATSCYVGDNTDLILMRHSWDLLLPKLAATVRQLADFARRWADLPTLGFTHFPPAQLTTVGKRATLWIQDLLMDLARWEQLRAELLLRGAKGTTGTQASFLSLFDGDEAKVVALDQAIADKMGFRGTFPVTGQTYPRKVDHEVVAALASFAVSAHKMAVDLRLLAHLKEVEEPFGAHQIGSSAMAYKRNPMRSERITSLARFLIHLPAQTAETAAQQWMERTLDDSANRRLVLPGAFLAADALLEALLEVTQGLVVYPAVIQRRIQEELPFMATEEILMAAVRAGGDRQTLHEALRRHSQEAAQQVKVLGRPNDLLERLAGDPLFAAVRERLAHLLDPAAFVGRAPQQVAQFLDRQVDPALAAYADRPVASRGLRV